MLLVTLVLADIASMPETVCIIPIARNQGIRERVREKQRPTNQQNDRQITKMGYGTKARTPYELYEGFNRLRDLAFLLIGSSKSFWGTRLADEAGQDDDRDDIRNHLNELYRNVLA